MSGVFLGDAFPLKDMAQVTITLTTKDLDSMTIGINFTADRA